VRIFISQTESAQATIRSSIPTKEFFSVLMGLGQIA